MTLDLTQIMYTSTGTPHASGVSNFVIPSANASGPGFGGTMSTLKPSVSRRNEAVVGPIAAMHTVLEDDEGSGSGKCVRRTGVTKSAAEGAK